MRNWHGPPQRSSTINDDDSMLVSSVEEENTKEDRLISGARLIISKIWVRKHDLTFFIRNIKICPI